MPSTLLTFRAPPALVDKLDDLTARSGAANRSELIRALIAEAVAHDDDDTQGAAHGVT